MRLLALLHEKLNTEFTRNDHDHQNATRRENRLGWRSKSSLVFAEARLMSVGLQIWRHHEKRVDQALYKSDWGSCRIPTLRMLAADPVVDFLLARSECSQTEMMKALYFLVCML